MSKITKAIIPAAGFGTRFLPTTKSLPKEMLPIIDKPTLQFVVEEAANAGITDILIVISRNKESIINHFDKNVELEKLLIEKNKMEELDTIRKIENLANIYYIRQDFPKGLGHAISLGEGFVGNDAFAILLGDVLIDDEVPPIKQIIDVYEKYQTSILSITEVAESDINKYGIISGEKIEDELYKVQSMVEKPSPESAPSNLAILGRYILTPKIFEILKNQKPGVNNEIQLTDALLELLKYEDIYAQDLKGKRYDIGSKFGYIMATIDRALSTPEFAEETKNYLRSIFEKYE